jgi:hypothetical protein
MAMRFSCLVLVGALVGSAQARGAAEVDSIACLPDGGILGRDTKKGGVAVWRDGTWAFTSQGELGDLWNVPGASPLICCRRGNRVQTFSGTNSGPEREWILPLGPGQLPTFSYVDGPLVANPERLFRLVPNGSFVDLGPVPPRPDGLKHHRGPAMMRGAAGWIACYGASTFERDATRGECVGSAPGIDFRADFGDYAAPGEIELLTSPFACGDVAIVAVGDATLARRLSDGKLVGRTTGPARRGSLCLPDGRALVVGKRSLKVFELPRLRLQWSREVGSEIRDVVVCGRQIVALVAKSELVRLDLEQLGRH